MKTPIALIVAVVEKGADALGISEAATRGLVRAAVAATWVGIAAAAEALAQNITGVGLPPWITPFLAAACMGITKYARSR